MDKTSSLLEILSTIESQFSSTISASKDPDKFTKLLASSEKMLEVLNEKLIDNTNTPNITDDEKVLIKTILTQVSTIETITNAKLKFFDSLNDHFSDNVKNKL